MDLRLKLCALTLLTLWPLLVFSKDRNAAASITFTIDFPNANPSHYEITLGSDGRGSYSSNGQLNHDSPPVDPAPLQFTVPNKISSQIFDLAQRAHYFTGNIDSGRKNIANTGAKTLAYQDAKRDTHASYNYSEVPAVEQVTALFQQLSTTLEFGRRLTFFHKYQKLALDEDLKSMERLQREGQIGDVQAIAPTLNEIANDATVMNVTRARALRMLASSGK